MRAPLILFFVLCFILSAPSGHTQTAEQHSKMSRLLSAPLFEPALNYTDIPKINECRERTLRTPKYHACRNSTQIYAKALANAKAKNQSLMVVFGFDSCPHCRRLYKQVFHPKHPMRNADIVKYFSKPAINAYVLHNQPLKVSTVYIHVRTKHGLKLADDLGVTKMAKARGGNRVWSPFIVFVNPLTGRMSSESHWNPEDTYCDWGADFAAGLEGIGTLQTGTPYAERKRCK